MDAIDNWPLSAAATQLLLTPKASAQVLLKLALKELVVVGSAVLSPQQQAHRRRTKTVIHLRPGSQPTPDRTPLPRLRRALFDASPDGGPLREMVAAVLKQDRELPAALRAEVLAELTTRGLVTSERKLLRTVTRRTTPGDELAQTVSNAREEWRVALNTGGPTAAAAALAATAAPGLVLLMDRSSLRAIDKQALRSPGERDASFVFVATGTGSDDDRVHWTDLDAIEGLSGLDAAVDTGVDAGSSDGGDGGGD